MKSRNQTASRVLTLLLPSREKCITLNKDDVIQVKEAFKWVMQGLLAKELGGVAAATRVKL